MSGCIGFGIDKKRNKGNNGVQCKCYPEKIPFRTFVADVFGNNVGAAGRGVGAKTYAINKATDHTAEHYRKNGVAAVGTVLQVFQPQMLQIEKNE